jgi:hypothetical protein
VASREPTGTLRIYRGGFSAETRDTDEYSVAKGLGLGVDVVIPNDTTTSGIIYDHDRPPIGRTIARTTPDGSVRDVIGRAGDTGIFLGILATTASDAASAALATVASDGRARGREVLDWGTVGA